MKNNLRIIMAIKDISIDDLYQKTTIAKTTLYGIYRCKSNPKILTIKTIAKVLDCTIDDIYPIEEVNYESLLRK